MFGLFILYLVELALFVYVVSLIWMLVKKKISVFYYFPLREKKASISSIRPCDSKENNYDIILKLKGSRDFNTLILRNLRLEDIIKEGKKPSVKMRYTEKFQKYFWQHDFKFKSIDITPNLILLNNNKEIEL